MSASSHRCGTRRRRQGVALAGSVLALAVATGAWFGSTADASHSVVSLVSTSPTAGNGAEPSIFLAASADGSRVVMRTEEQLTPDDTDIHEDVYERAGGVTTRLTVDPDGGNQDSIPSFAGASKDLKHVFIETGQQLSALGDGDGYCHSGEGVRGGCVDVLDRSGGTTKLISTGPTGGGGDFQAKFLAASDDGSRAFFYTKESMVSSDTDIAFDIYERVGGVTNLISVGPAGGNGNVDAVFSGLSSDGTRVFFETPESLVAGDSDGATDVYERNAGTTTLVSGGSAAKNAQFSGASADGTHVFFETEEQLTGSDSDSVNDVYDRSGGTTTLVSVGGGTRDAFFRGASRDGSRVFFESKGQLVATDLDNASDVYERSGGTTTLVSTGALGGNGNVDSLYQGSSSDGSRVFIGTTEVLAAGDADSRFDVYERASAATTLISTGPSGGNGASDATFAGASEDGKRVFFETYESLMGTDTDPYPDVYERSEGITYLLSGTTTNTYSYLAGQSRDGNRVFIHTGDPLLGSLDTDTQTDIYETALDSTYVRPKGATPTIVALVPAYLPCPNTVVTSSNRSHGAPFVNASCNPPVTRSPFLTVGTPDANSAAANMSGYVRTDVCPVPGCAAPNVQLAAQLTDIRCKAGASPCGATNTAGGADYTGELGGFLHLRLTDRYNGSADTDSATTEDFDVNYTMQCFQTSGDASKGSDCSILTTMNSLVPGALASGKRVVAETNQLRVRDGGADGDTVTSDGEQVLAIQGVFLP